MNYKRSSSLFIDAKKNIPGGVNSPVRAFKAVGGDPIFIKKAKGTYLYDVDGNKYIDFISSWGPMILGHANNKVIKAIKARIEKGISFGAPTELETKIAMLALKMVPNIDKIRFVNSGTEACMSAIRLARGYTKRDKIIKFVGCYHGHADAFLIQAGSGAICNGTPNSPGVTKGNAKDTILAKYNDISSVLKIFKKNINKIAAIIIEPVAGNMGCVIPKPGFLEDLRSLCDKYKSLLIFDEVMTGFRLSAGGAQESLSIKADIITFGKIIGGGLPVGAFASSNEIMNELSPIGKIYQAGTLSGNPVAMEAGFNTLKILNNHPEIYKNIDLKTKKIHDRINSILERNNVPYHINRFGSMFSLHFTEDPVINFETALKGNNNYFKKYFHGMLNEGVYLPPSPFESCFINNEMNDSDIDYTINAFERVIKKL